MAVPNYRRGLIWLTCAWALAACESETWTGAAPVADMAMFDSQVYPVLLRDCGFNACHGSDHRFFQVFGPGRVRIDPMQDPALPATPLELEVTYKRAVSMLITQGPVEHSPLLTKPLESLRGGSGHKGVDDFGRNVYATPRAAGYQTLLTWAHTASYSNAPVVGLPTAGSSAVAGSSASAGSSAIAGSPGG